MPRIGNAKGVETFQYVINWKYTTRTAKPRGRVNAKLNCLPDHSLSAMPRGSEKMQSKAGKTIQADTMSKSIYHQ